MDIRLLDKVDRGEFIRLYEDAGWWDDEYYSDTSFIDRVVSGSVLFAGAFDPSGGMVGMGRAISDGCSDAYIQDLVVLSEHRGKGIGKGIVRFLITELGRLNIDWIGLVAEPGSKKFYEGLGFRKMKKHCPMIFVPPPLRDD